MSRHRRINDWDAKGSGSVRAAKSGVLTLNQWTESYDSMLSRVQCLICLIITKSPFPSHPTGRSVSRIRRSDSLRHTACAGYHAYSNKLLCAYYLRVCAQGRHPEVPVFQHNALSADASVYASRVASRRPTQNSRSGCFPTPFLEDSFIPYYMPV